MTHKVSPPFARPPAHTSRLGRPVRFVLAACACAVLAACGGGDDRLASVGTGGTGSFAIGSINGLGSVYVNGVRFHTVGASVTNPNAPASTGTLTPADLQLGMTVEVRGEINPSTLSGSAASVVIASEFKGPVTRIDPNSLVIFGRTVQITAATIFAGRINDTTPVTSLSQLAAGHVVEIYGLPQPDGSLRATRIEFEAANLAAFQAEYPTERFHVEGVLTNLSGTAPNRSFDVAGVRFNETASTAITGTLANGAEVTAALAPTAAPAPFSALAVRVESRSFAPGIGLAEIEGLVSDWNSTAGTFNLQGFPVRLDSGAVFEDGTRTNLVNGVRVEVYGHIVNGVLVATKVEFEDEDRDQDPFEFAGLATCPATPCGDPSGSFTVRGVTIHYNASTRFEDGATRTNLNGTRVEVEARLDPADGNRFIAIRVEREG